MSADVEGWHVVPKIQIDVVLFALVECLLLVHTGSGNHEELVLQDANGVTVATEFEFVSCNAIENLVSGVDNFEALFERGGVLGNVTAANQKQPIRLGLHVLEVVLEFVGNIDSALVQGLFQYIVHVDHF